MRLRSRADCRAIMELAKIARQVVVLGASFIGLEVAAALRARKIEVHVVAPEKRPMERILGPQMGDFVRSLHEEHGVIFHLEDVASAVDANRVVLRSGSTVAADFVVAGLGVRPRTQFAEKAGVDLDRGVVVDAYLKTNVPGIFAAGDITRWPDPHSGDDIRVEPGLLLSARVKPQRSACWAIEKSLFQSHSSGANTTTYRSTTSDMPINGTISASKVTSSHATA